MAQVECVLGKRTGDTERKLSSLRVRGWEAEVVAAGCISAAGSPCDCDFPLLSAVPQFPQLKNRDSHVLRLSNASRSVYQCHHGECRKIAGFLGFFKRKMRYMACEK